MPSFQPTISYPKPKKNISSEMLLTIVDGYSKPRTIRLAAFGKREIHFGQNLKNDIVLTSKFASDEHGRLVWQGDTWVIEDKAVYLGKPSKNGILYNNSHINSHAIHDGDFIRIDRLEERSFEGVLFLFSSSDTSNQWIMFPLTGREVVSIGRDPKRDICLPHISVSNSHAKIVRESDGYYLVDCNSRNGVILNNSRISHKERLQEKDIITITNSKLIFMTTMLFYCYSHEGISVDVNNVVVQRGKGRKSFLTSRDVTFSVKPGELVAIVGGSGAGKSTILNCMCGYLRPTKGSVFINGLDLYQNFNFLKKLVGYVPQSDIVYNNLSLDEMLFYTAKLRLPKDTSFKEREAAIDRAISLVELQDKRDSLIKSLSGGQRKRASIAVELVSDPKLLLLDEPASGLDPGTERSLMISLREMANRGKTVVLVTHSTLQLQLCDKIAFLGNGGYLCFYGTYEEAMAFFKVSSIVDIYELLTNHAAYWSERYARTRFSFHSENKTSATARKRSSHSFSQFCVLSSRYIKLLTHDSKRILMLLGQAPLLALLISLVADGNQFEQYEMTKSLLFALSCAAFWVGMLNAIQEICKERIIVKREYMTGLSLNAYLASKMLILGGLSLIQSALMTIVLTGIIGLPKEGVITHPFLELLAPTFVTTVAATSIGLFVSSLFSNADRALTIAPILLMPQILFSGLIFKLDGATEYISWAAVSRWSVEGYGTTANLNALPLRLQQQGVSIPHEAEAFFEFSPEHLFHSWGILALYVLLCYILARIALGKIGEDRG